LHNEKKTCAQREVDEAIRLGFLQVFGRVVEKQGLALRLVRAKKGECMWG
jgi:hypothetical protein